MRTRAGVKRTSRPHAVSMCLPSYAMCSTAEASPLASTQPSLAGNRIGPLWGCESFALTCTVWLIFSYKKAMEEKEDDEDDESGEEDAEKQFFTAPTKHAASRKKVSKKNKKKRKGMGTDKKETGEEDEATFEAILHACDSLSSY